MFFYWNVTSNWELERKHVAWLHLTEWCMYEPAVDVSLPIDVIKETLCALL